jgi:hypothetical protein
MNPDVQAIAQAIKEDQAKGPIDRPVVMVPKGSPGAQPVGAAQIPEAAPVNAARPGPPLPAVLDLAQRHLEMDNSPLDLETKAPIETQPFKDAGSSVSGMTVRDHIPNMSSIDASLEHPDILPGIKEVPLSAFKGYEPPKVTPRVSDLASQIQSSGEMNPLIVAFDKDGPYVIEGGHRLDAAIHLGKDSIPAKVVIDTENPPSWYGKNEEIPFDSSAMGQVAKQLNTSAKAAEVNREIGVRPDDVKFGANPGQRILDENLRGKTNEATKANVDAALKDAGEQLQAGLKAADEKGVTVDAQTPVYDAYAKLGEKYGVTRDISNQAQVGVIDKIEAKYPDLEKLSPIDAHKLKVELGDSIDWKNTDNPVNQMMKQIYRSINDSVKSADESVGPAQDRWGDLYIASRSLKSTLAKEAVGRPIPKAPQKFGFGLTQP